MSSWRLVKLQILRHGVVLCADVENAVVRQSPPGSPMAGATTTLRHSPPCSPKTPGSRGYFDFTTTSLPTSPSAGQLRSPTALASPYPMASTPAFSPSSSPLPPLASPSLSSSSPYTPSTPSASSVSMSPPASSSDGAWARGSPPPPLILTSPSEAFARAATPLCHQRPPPSPSLAHARTLHPQTAYPPRAITAPVASSHAHTNTSSKTGGATLAMAHATISSAIGWQAPSHPHPHRRTKILPDEAEVRAKVPILVRVARHYAMAGFADLATATFQDAVNLSRRVGLRPPVW
jgi:hypothetical protein